MADDVARCAVCGEPMPPGETMFKFHGYSGPCPKPPKPKKYSYDSECEKLSRHFLIDCDLPHKADIEADVRELAQEIQDAVEMFFSTRDIDWDDLAETWRDALKRPPF